MWRVGLALMVVGACASLEQRPWPPPPPARDAHLGIGIQTTALANGLRVVVVTDPNATEVQLTTRYQVGAVDDSGHPGLAHLVEHLMFQQVQGGQPMFSRLEDDASYFNGATTYDSTTYVARAPVTALDELIGFEAVRLEQRCATIPEAAFAHEREVVANEIRQRDQTAEIFAAIHHALYPEGHPYRGAVGGTVETVAAITRDEACRFVDAYYVPQNAVIVLSGHLSAAEISRALAALGSGITRRGGEPPHRITPVPLRPVQVEASAPIDDDVLVLAWPLPTEPVLQAKIRAIAAWLPHSVDAQIKGSVVAIEFGDARAPMLGLAVLPGDDETFGAATAGTRRGIENLPTVFAPNVRAHDLDDAEFERIKRGALYHAYASLEGDGDRDGRLASYVFAGRDPRAALDAELAALGALTRAEGAQLVAQYLSANTPTVVNLRAATGKRRGKRASMAAALHDMGPRRTPVDAALATRPAEHAPVPALDLRTRVLPNGLRVVLLPDTSVPTVDARLIFRAGTGDEPPEQRGVALLAAHTLTWDMHYINDLVAFVAAGASRDAQVGTDRTSFAVQGLDANLDQVLAGLRRWVRDGTYDDSAGGYVRALRHATKGADDQGLITDAWRAALFGASHPYVDAGVPRHANNGLTLADAMQFRATHFTPDNAALVIAGHFDPAVADRWIDFLFADWTGRAGPRASLPGTGSAASLAKIDDVALLQLRIALPVAAARPQALVAAEMLDEIAHDVRYSLGASYTLDAQLAETRLARFDLLAGWIDAPRAAASVQLVRDRLRELRGDQAAAMRAFVVARRHVLNSLRAQLGSASALAAAVDRDVELGRAPMSDVQTARDVEALTFADMTAALGELDLARATVLMDGPAADLKRAFDVLGRKPAYLDPPLPASGAGPSATPVAFASPEQHVPLSELAPSLTDQPPPRGVLIVSPALAVSSRQAVAALNGYELGATVAYRLTWQGAVGVHVDLGAQHGSALDPSAVPVNVAAVAHLELAHAVWLDGLLGLHAERLTPAGMTPAPWATSPFWGVELGTDLWSSGVHRLGLGVALETTFDSQLRSTLLSLGVVYRR